MLAAALGALLMGSLLAFAATTPWTLCALQIGAFALAVWCTARGPLRANPVMLALGGVIAWAAIQLLSGTTVYRFATTNALVNWAAYLALAIVGAHALADPAVRRRFLEGLRYAGFTVAMLSTAQHFTSEGAIYWILPARAGHPFGPFVNPDHYAAFAELILPLAILEAGRDPRRIWLRAAMAGALYASVIASASRAGAILATGEVLVLPWIAPADDKRRSSAPLKILAASVLCAGAATAVVGWDVLWKRFHESDPFRYRREVALSTLEMIRAHPWSGIGLGTFANVYPEFASFDLGLYVDHAHDDWAEWTAEGGLPMLVLMAAIAAIGFRAAWRSVWGLGIYAVFLHALVDFPMQIPAIAALVFTLLGALTAGYRLSFRRSYT